MMSEKGMGMEQQHFQLPKALLSKAGEIRNKISPEKEYVFGALATYVYLSVVLNAETIPVAAQPLAELVESDPHLKIQLLFFVMLAFLATIDGAQRIVIEKLPIYRAFIKVYLLNTSEVEHGSLENS